MPYNFASGGTGTTTWRASTTIAAWDASPAATNPNVPEVTDGLVALVAYGRAFGDNARGKVMYEAGHNHNGTSASFVNAQRVFFNFSFLSTFDKDPLPAPVASSVNILAGETISLSLTVRPGFNLSDYNLFWTSQCGGTFSDPFSANPTFTAPAVNPCGPCKLTVTLTDACGRQFYENINLTICPAPPVALDRTTAVINNPPGTGPQAVGAMTPMAGTDPDGTIVSYTITSLPNASHGLLSITCPPTPAGAACSGGFANLTAAVLAANPGGILLTPAQAQSFRFDPADGFGGNATFNYTVTDNHGLVDATPAIFTIPVNPPPIAQDILTTPIPSNAGITPLSPPLLATDNGSIVSYTIVSLPPSGQGILYLNGVPVAVGQVLTPAQAGQLSFDPSGSFIGYAQVTYTATDNNGAVDATPATLSIQIVNQPPVAQDITAPVMANPNGTGQTPIPALAATDSDGTITSYTVSSVPLVSEGVLYYFNGSVYTEVAGGQVLTPAQAASLRFDPADGFTGNARFTYSATDNLGLVDNTPASYNIPVGIVPPLADAISNPAIYSGAAQTAINPLSGNDPDATNIISSFTVSTIPAANQGVLYFDNAGTYVPVTAGQLLTPAQAASLRFDPANGFTGNVIFYYTVTDDEGLTDQSPASYTIPVINQPPVATAVTNPAINNSAGPTGINPLAATDADGTVATYTITSLPSPAKGMLLLSGTPVVPGQVLTPAQLTLLQFDPAPGATGNAVFNFTATDDQGATDETPATFTIPLIAVPIPPTTDDKTNGSINVAAGPTPISALTGMDSDGSIISFVINTLPPAVQGVLMLNGVPVTAGQVIPVNSAGQLQFDPSGTYTGNSVFTYSAVDNDGFTDASPATFTIPIVNNPPIADNITINNVKTNSTVRIPSLTATDPDGTIASYTVSTLPAGCGTLQVDLTGTNVWTNVTPGQVLTPAQASRLRIISGVVIGNCTFTFTATDNLGNTDATPATYTIPISSQGNVNQPPAVFDVVNPAINASAGQTAINPLQGSDPDGVIDLYTLLSIPPPSQGILYYNNGTGFVAITEGGLEYTPAQMATFRFDPSGNFIGNVYFTYTAHDDDGNIAVNPANYTIPIINNPPVANNITNASMNSSAGPTGISSLTATDADGTVASYRVTSIPQASQGILILDGTAVVEGQVLTPAQAARLQFDPAPSFSGNATFTYTAIDNLGATDQTPAVFTIPVVNQPPTADDKISQIITNSIGTGQQPIPALTGRDEDGSIVSFTINNLPANGVLYFNGVPATVGLVIPAAQANLLTFDPNDGFSGNTTFNYTTTDNNGNTDASPALFTIRVNTPPTTDNITGPAFYAGGSNAPIPPLTGADDGSVQFYSVTALPPVSQGSLYLNGVLVSNLSQVDTLTAFQVTQLSFTPAVTFTGTTFAYTATDNLGIIDVTPAVYTIPQKIIVSGLVWDDANGGLTQDGAEAVINGTNSGGGVTTGAVLYVNLINAAGTVVAVAPVMADGTYEFPTVTTNATYVVQLTTIAGTVGQPKPATVLPAGWATTGENKNGLGGFPDATPNSEMVINTNNTHVLTQNFGMERLPNSDMHTTNIPQPVVGTIKVLNGGVNPPVLSGIDPEDCNTGCTLANKSVLIDAVPSNSDLFYNGVLVTNGQLINNLNPDLLEVRMTVATIGATSTSFQYSYVDLAGKKDPSPATYALTWLSPLPVTLTSFTGMASKCEAILQWKTAQEINLDKFVVEQSDNGLHFIPVAEIQSASTPLGTSYQQSVAQPTGMKYYRLKMMDKDGRYSYSPVITVRTNCGSADYISVYPNPVTTDLTVSFKTAYKGQAVVQLKNALGQQLLSRQIQITTAVNTIKLDLGNFGPGLYLLSLLNGSGEKIGEVQKLIKK